MDELIREFLDKDNVFAVVGASRNPDKYGHKVYQNLKDGGYVVYPVNPNSRQVLGEKCYPSLSDLPVKPDVVDLVVPPPVTLEVVHECRRLDIDKVWMQPGSESQEAIDFCAESGIKAVYGVCVMAERQSSKNV